MRTSYEQQLQSPERISYSNPTCQNLSSSIIYWAGSLFPKGAADLVRGLELLAYIHSFLQLCIYLFRKHCGRRPPLQGSDS
jgi:hypothetical protein